MSNDFLSKRVKRKSQSGITSDRYEFLSLDQAEPDLGDPTVGPSSALANSFSGDFNSIYFLGADSTGTGKRYWLDQSAIVASSSVEGISVRENSVLVGSAGSIKILDFTGDVGVSATVNSGVATITFSAGAIQYASAAGVATALQNSRTFEITGDIIASPISFNGTGNVSLAATIQPNSVGLGTDTTGNYVTSITNGSYITGANGGSEGAILTIGVAATSANTSGQVVARDASGNFSAGIITASLSGTATSIKGGNSGDIPYQTSADTTAFINASTASVGQVVLWDGSAPYWGNVSAAEGTFGGISVRDEGSIVGTANSITTLNFVGSQVNVVAASGPNGVATVTISNSLSEYATNAGIATYANNAGIATYATSSGIATYATSSGIATYATTAGVATALQNSRTFEITGDIIASPISFNGTGNVSLAATIQPNSVGLGTDTFGDYVKDITGTANQITVTSGTGEGSSPILSIPSQFTAPQDITVTRDLQVNRNLNVNGNITLGGTSATIFSQSLNIFDPDIVLGYRTDANNNDISTDNTASHGGIAIASTEGNPLVQLFIAGIETNPATYKKIMWFKAGEFAGLGTDAWLFNYAVGIGSTQFPTGTRLAAGNVQFTQNDLAVVRNINSSGVVTATSFVKSGGTSSQYLKADGSVDSSTYITSYTETDTLNSVTGRGNSTSNGISVGVLTATTGNFSGIVTSSGAVISGPTTATSFVKSGGTSSQFLKADGSVDSSTYLSSTSSGSNLTGIVTSIIAGNNITVSGSTGIVTIATKTEGTGEFNTGITSSIYVSVTSGIATGIGGVGISTADSQLARNNDIFIGPGIAHSFPSTAGKKYVIESIHITNTFSNELYFTARHDFNGGSNVPMAQRVVIPYQGATEYLYNNKMVANPSDILRFQAFVGVGTTATGIDGGLDAFITYSEKTDTNYIGTGKTVSNISGTEIFQASTNPVTVQSIRVCNYNLNIDVDASISIYRGSLASGVRLGYLVYNLTIPKNSVIEVIDKSKYLAIDDSIVVSSSTTGISVFFAGKYIT